MNGPLGRNINSHTDLFFLLLDYQQRGKETYDQNNFSGNFSDRIAKPVRSKERQPVQRTGLFRTLSEVDCLKHTDEIFSAMQNPTTLLSSEMYMYIYKIIVCTVFVLGSSSEKCIYI